ncbi:NPCBM/NEW2 domain-containing protein [Deinococcus koreensis]|nr:NPCBM/NEW2 domain-containing protein [Deinococcus koreensis]
MFRPVRLVLLACGLSGLLVACGMETPAGGPEVGPYAGGRAYPWSYTAPAGQLMAQRLTPTRNTLQYETILAAKSGWGPIELNRSNGEQGPHDGRPLTLNGTSYAWGFGTHAHSEMVFNLQGYNDAGCTRFTADVGVDDEVGNRGSVNFLVLVDGVQKYASGTMTGASATRHVDVDLTEGWQLKLVVADAGDGINFDHADWVNPEVTCVRLGRIIDYGFHFEPDSLCLPQVDSRVELTLVVEDRGIQNTTLPSGPISFRMIVGSPIVDKLDVAEPNRIYATTTFPARFKVAVNVSASLYGVNGAEEKLEPVLEDYFKEFGHVHPAPLTLNTCT